MRTRTLLITIIILLVLLLFGAGTAFFYVTTPPGKPDTSETTGSFVWLRSVYGFGEIPEAMLEAPSDSAFDASGRIYVTDPIAARIMVFSPGGDFQRLIHRPQEGEGQIIRPLGIAFADGGAGDLYVADLRRNAVLRFTQDGEFVAEWSDDQPLALDVVGDRVYVACADHVSIYSTAGELIDSWGSRGREPGQVDFPHGIAADEDGTIWLADSNNKRIQHLEPDGTPIAAIGEPAQSAMDPEATFGLPVDLALDGDGHIVLVDALNFELLILDLEGNVVDRYDSYGSFDGQLWYPSGIGLDTTRGLLVVADTGNNRGQVFEILLPGQNRLVKQVTRTVMSPFCYGPLLLLLFLIVAWIVSVVLRRRRREDEVFEDEGPFVEEDLQGA